MRKTIGFLTVLLFTVMFCTSGVQAKISADEAARLGKDLTPVGGEKAGNAEGTIPAWTGGITQPPANYKPGDHHPDPFADEKVLFKINSANMAKYADKLSEGHKALLKADPDYYLNVYPTHRSASSPQRIYDATKRVAQTALLTEDGNGIVNAAVGLPFPIAKNGLEAIWNHLVHWRGECIDRTFVYSPVTRSGDYNLGTENTQVRWQYSQPGMTEENMDNVILFFKMDLLGPPRVAGRILIVHDTLNQKKETRKAWTYNTGQRRVRRAPQVAFDTPGTGSDGLRTMDDYGMYNGSPERYEWKLLGKKEMYVAYNSYKLHSDKLKYKDIIKPMHYNPEYLRYELHRVWVVEANLKKGTRHIYKKRVFYLDEDSWSVIATDKYDNRDQLWRFSESFVINYYEVPCTWSTSNIHYDLQAGRYVFMYLDNEERSTYNFNVDFPVKNFSTSALRRSGRR
ncbi:MAG: DUF1329 domain-containing protein [Pseudomonadota bacterium]|nr:DUF1329 domain-containing protein [Pseudomonadota bacterium]